MPISRELWVAYTRIFFVEAAYWIISIGMVFVNEFVLSGSILTDDLTIFITIFQILFSLAILVTLNHITKNYLDPTFGTTYKHHGANPANKRQPKEYHDDEEARLYEASMDSDGNSQEDDEDEEEVLFVSVNAKLIDQHDKDRHDMEKEQNQQKLRQEGNGKNNYGAKRKLSSFEAPCDIREGASELKRSSQDSLTQLFIVNIPQRINLETCKIVFPLSILYIGMLLLNNFCLKNVGVAFYFVSRSLTTVFNVMFTYLLINEPVSRGAIICCAFIVLGFFLGIDQENVIGSLSVIGVSFGVASSLFGSLCSIYTKKTLDKLNKNIWVLALYNYINAIVLCTPLLIMHGDIQSLVSDKVVNPTFWLFLSISGVMAFFISIVTNASIKYTSPLTHNISGTAKACLQTVIAVIYSRDHKSTLWWLSNITILVASAVYSRIKQQEMERKSSGGGGSNYQHRPSYHDNIIRTHRQQQQQQQQLLVGGKVEPNGMTPLYKDRRDSSSSSGCSVTSGRHSRTEKSIERQQGRQQQQQQRADKESADDVQLDLVVATNGVPTKECCSVKIQSAT